MPRWKPPAPQPGISIQSMLTENQVVDAVEAHLVRTGWTAVSKASILQHGPGILAGRDGRRLVVEAKGATSSKEWTARFFRPFAGKQVRTHISVALYTCLCWRDDPKNTGDVVAIALPDTSTHRTKAEHMAPPLAALNIRVFWVSEDGTVR